VNPLANLVTTWDPARAAQALEHGIGAHAHSHAHLTQVLADEACGEMHRSRSGLTQYLSVIRPHAGCPDDSMNCAMRALAGRYRRRRNA